MNRETKERDDKGFDPSSTVRFYALLMAAVGCANVWLYWYNGSRLSLVVAGVAFVGMIVWILWARRMLA